MGHDGAAGHAIVLANVTPTRQAERSMTKARRHEGGAMKLAMTLPTAVLERGRLRLNREFKLRSSPRTRGPRLCRKNWVPASAGTNGDASTRSNRALAAVLVV